MNKERYGVRDLTYSRWHRLLPGHCTTTDIDFVEYCWRCRQPLALVEVAIDVGQTSKKTAAIKALAATMRVSIPVYLVFYRKTEAGEIDRFRVREVYPEHGEEEVMEPKEWADHLISLHTTHICDDS